MLIVIFSLLNCQTPGPEHAYLRDSKRVSYRTISDEQAMEAFFLLSRHEGIIPAIESAHALAYALKCSRDGEEKDILVNLSGRGDKDIDFVYRNYGTGETFTDKRISLKTNE